VCFGFKGGGGLKFSDVILAVASFAVLDVLLEFVFSIALIPANTWVGFNLAGILSVLVSALIIGYVFAGKIHEESRMMSIGKIVVLTAALMTLAVMAEYSTLPHYGLLVDNNLQTSSYYKSSWTNTDWLAFEHLMLVEWVAVPLIYVLVFSFIGLYLGSMRKPSPKTK
jgi:hypothetical protein